LVHRLEGYGEGGGALSPISLDHLPACTLEQALDPLTTLVPDLDAYLYCSTSWAEEQVSVPHGLSIDQAAAINLYTKEWTVKVSESTFECAMYSIGSLERKKKGAETY
jgi:hypothetical protein